MRTSRIEDKEDSMKAVKTFMAGALVAVFCRAVGMVDVRAIPTWLIKGKIIDATTKQPVEGVEVSMRDKAMNRLYTAKTNKDGIYLQRLPLGVVVGASQAHPA